MEEIEICVERTVAKPEPHHFGRDDSFVQLGQKKIKHD
jgi:hypothetical protein